MSNQQLTDLSYLREMAMGDEDIIIETAEVFLEDIPQSLEKMKALYATENWDELAKLAHKIKPNFSYMGISRGKELIIDIEQQAKSENISDNLQQQIKELDQVCGQASKELSAKVQELKSA